MANTKVSSEQIIDDVALAGNPTTTTQGASDNSTKVATTAYVTTAVSNLVDSAPSSLNTLNELAAAMSDNASFFSTVLPLSGGTMSGALNMGSQNITNAGTIALAGGLTGTSATFTDDVAINNGSPEMYFGTTGNHYNWRIAAQELVDAAFEIAVGSQDNNYANDTYTQVFNIKNTGNATFAGTISSGAITSSGTLTAPTLIAGAYGAGGSAGDGFRINTTDIYGQTDASDKIHLSAVSGNATLSGDINLSSHGIKLNQDFGSGVPTITMLGTAANGRAGAIHFTEQGDVSTAAIYSTDGGTGNSSYGGLTIATYQSDLRFATGGLSSTRMTIGTDGYIEMYRNANEYGLQLKSAGTRSGMVLMKPATDTIMGSVLMLSDESYRLGTASHYHMIMYQNGATYLYGNDSAIILGVDGTGMFSNKNRYRFTDTTGGEHEVRTGGRNGTGTYTLFTNGSSSTQSAGTVEVWGIYGTPSGASYTKYLISGNRSIATVISEVETNSVPTATVSWNGAALQVTNSNSSLYYHVRVELHDIGNGWSPTWGNFPGFG
jgi:hypothetical protein